MSNSRQDILDWLEKNRRPEIRIYFKKAEQPLALGVSKIGGCPDVPADFVWPCVAGGGFYGDKNAEPIDYDSMKKPEFDSFFAGSILGSVFSAKSFEEVRAIQWAKLEERQRQDPNYQLPQGDKLKQLEEHWKQSYLATKDFMGMQKSFFDTLSDEEWRESQRPDPEFEKRSKISRPLAFMAQFNLSEFADLDKENLLPKSGHLLFFYDCESGDWGENQQCARVFYFPPQTPLKQMPLPDDIDKDYRIPELQVSFQAGSSVPYFGNLSYRFNNIYDTLGDDTIEEIWQEGRDNMVKLLGHPDNDADDGLFESCVLRSSGWDWDDYNDNPQIKNQVEKDKDDWILLFQLDSIDWGNPYAWQEKMAKMTQAEIEAWWDNGNYKDEEVCCLMFGEYDSLYFFIHKEDLANRRFDKVCFTVGRR